MDSHSLRLSLFALILLLSAPAFPAEFYDEAEVIRSEPITRTERTRHLAFECFSKPGSHDLLELLHWDLGTGHCSVEETTETVTGYRVYYQWDGQVFSQVMTKAPGSHIPVRVTLE